MKKILLLLLPVILLLTTGALAAPDLPVIFDDKPGGVDDPSPPLPEPIQECWYRYRYTVHNSYGWGL